MNFFDIIFMVLIRTRSVHVLHELKFQINIKNNLFESPLTIFLSYKSASKMNVSRKQIKQRQLSSKLCTVSTGRIPYCRAICQRDLLDQTVRFLVEKRCLANPNPRTRRRFGPNFHELVIDHVTFQPGKHGHVHTFPRPRNEPQAFSHGFLSPWAVKMRKRQR